MADRDRYVPKHQTPPKGSAFPRAPSAAEDFSGDSGVDLTPIENPDPLAQATGRAQQAATSSKTAVKMVRELQRSQNELSERLAEYAENDKKDHAALQTEIGEIKSDVKTLGEHVGGVRVDLATVLGKLEIMTPNYELRQRNKAHAERIKLDYSVSVKKLWWHTALKIVGVVGGALALAGAGWLLHMHLGGG